jgi:putative lipoic acid-binding regulatory protein
MESPSPESNSGKNAEGLPSLLTFPCAYPLRVMGVAGSEFQARAIEIVRHHVPDIDGSTIETRPSREGRYVSYTFRFTATSRDQLDQLYTELNQCELVKAIL